MADLFAPPSKDELALFAPPSKEEMSLGQGDKPGYLESGGRGFLQGASAGFSDEGIGAAGAVSDAANGGQPTGWKEKAMQFAAGPASTVAQAGANLYRGNTSVSDIVKNYVAKRDAERNANDAAHSANPATYTGGNIAGALATTPLLPGAGTVRGAAALGGAYGLGNSNADLTKGEYKRAALDTAVGAGTGAALQTIGNRLVEPIISGTMPESLAIRHLRPTPSVARALGQDRLMGVGREALDSGSIKFGAKAGDTAERLGAVAEDSGKKIGSMRDAAEGTVSSKDLAEQISRDVIDPLRKAPYANADLIAKLEAQNAELVAKHPNPLSAASAEAEKSALYDKINWNSGDKPSNVAQKDTARVFKEAGEGLISDPNFIPEKSRYGNLKSGQAMAERSSALTDSGGGLMGHIADVAAGHEAIDLLAHGNPVGLAVAGGRMATKGRVASSAAVATDQISKAIEKLGNIPGGDRFIGVLRNAMNRGQGSAATTHFLLQQTEPEYNKAVNSGE